MPTQNVMCNSLSTPFLSPSLSHPHLEFFFGKGFYLCIYLLGGKEEKRSLKKSGRGSCSDFPHVPPSLWHPWTLSWPLSAPWNGWTPRAGVLGVQQGLTEKPKGGASLEDDVWQALCEIMAEVKGTNMGGSSFQRCLLVLKVIFNVIYNSPTRSMLSLFPFCPGRCRSWGDPGSPALNTKAELGSLALEVQLLEPDSVTKQHVSKSTGFVPVLDERTEVVSPARALPKLPEHLRQSCPPLIVREGVGGGGELGCDWHLPLTLHPKFPLSCDFVLLF